MDKSKQLISHFKSKRFKEFGTFSVIALVVLLIGCVIAQIIWHLSHHRYDMPETGLYYGSVSAVISSNQEFFQSLYFKSTSPKQWYWSRPMNFRYSTVEITWDDGAINRHATVNLSAFTYESGDESGAFTREVLAKWLSSSEDYRPDIQQIDTFFKYLEAAAIGSLPPPSHHEHNLNQPVRVRIDHFQNGFGVGSTVYVWFLFWGGMALIIGRSVFAND